MITYDNIKAVDVDIAGDQIIVTWDDGQRSAYPHRLLRLRCPCATCVEEMTGRALLDPDSVPSDVRALDCMTVGQYAVQFLWSDAHYTGIYPYRMLRQICRSIDSDEEQASQD